MNYKLLLVLLGVALPGLAMGQDSANYQCAHGDLQRRVEIVYETGGAMPCEVQYHKDTEAPGEHQVLWRANNEAGYCEARASEFVVKLEGWGWDCGSDAPSAPEPASEPDAPAEPDDTEALAPADESDS